ncbi:hypothetical protein LX32DRAFT_643411 [Colletotrichum zoysiae]|uniref:Uncharacterized protein n=1 Tax=Colletotrichum zoysiae TaxID=1216348 RepID=A0AAD9HAT6_9PEZI|nr:hypothetical protein LX32DRAFT_643411 [Colletotrichum zoysiae]
MARNARASRSDPVCSDGENECHHHHPSVGNSSSDWWGNGLVIFSSTYLPDRLAE